MSQTISEKRPKDAQELQQRMELLFHAFYEETGMRIVTARCKWLDLSNVDRTHYKPSVSFTAELEETAW